MAHFKFNVKITYFTGDKGFKFTIARRKKKLFFKALLIMPTAIMC